MNSIIIRKYEYQSDKARNYFASPTFIDGIELSQIHIEGFPIFNEEFSNQYDSFQFVASDFDLVFSRTDNTLTTEGDTLEQLLSADLDNHCLACKVDIGGKVFGGLIDVNSIKFIDDHTADGYKIQLTVFDWAKEFSQFAQGKPTRANGGTINSYLGSNLFAAIDGSTLPAYFAVNTDSLNWEARVGYVPVIIRELWFFIINSGGADSCVTWKLFEDLCKAFGLIYKFTVIGEVGNYYWVSLNVAFRDTGFTDANAVTLKWISRERGYISDVNANTIQCFKFMKEEPISAGTYPADPNENHFYGTVFNKDNVTTADGYVYTLAGGTGEEGLYSNGGGLSINKLTNPFPFDVADKVNFVEMNYYFDMRYGGSAAQWVYYVLVDGDARLGWGTTRQAKYISFPRLFTKDGYVIGGESNITTHNPRSVSHPENIHTLWYSLIENTCGVVYKFLLSTFKMYAQGRVSLADGLGVNLFDHDSINHLTHKIFKLSNLDLNNKETDVYMVSD